MKLAVSVVLYNPSNDVFDNIKTYADFAECLIVVDNSEIKNSQLIKKIHEFYLDKLVYIDNKNNLGIATALNLASDNAIRLGYQWLLTMDQDSRFVNFEHYIQCLLSVENYDGIGIFAANTTRNAIEQLPKTPTCSYEERLIVITSANIINLKYFNQVGRFDDGLFIDMVDYDYCLKINLAKLKVLFFKNVFVEHELGEIKKRKNLLTRKEKYKIEHSYQRAYYIARNYLYMAKKYHNLFPKEFSYLKTINIVYVHDVTKILLYESNKWKKIKAKIIAGIHFLWGKNGRYDLQF
ncbi:MAG: hypothetical protein RBR07_09815 [Arcobacteraceae bacterium]|nr:hypothetical protein [Arcobacteraceae bacterium]